MEEQLVNPALNFLQLLMRVPRYPLSPIFFCDDVSAVHVPTIRNQACS